jgi:NAD(P)-dependent dehydrogenase (short-subunit alcohol dehydrogenase family)
MYRIPDRTSRRIVVTGANSGTGKKTAKRLADAGGQIVMAVRTPAKGEAASPSRSPNSVFDTSVAARSARSRGRTDVQPREVGIRAKPLLGY